METYFSTDASFWVLEMDMLSITNHFLCISLETPARESFFSVYWKPIFQRILHSGYWKRIFLSNADRYFTWKFFSTSGNRHCYKWKPIFKDISYCCQWKLIFWLAETLFFHCLLYFSRIPSFQIAEKHFSVQKNSIVFYSELSFLLVKIII